MFYLVYGCLYALSLIPLRLLYLGADLVFFLIYHVLGYRRNVVDANLQIAFPEKTAAERAEISKKFYRNFVDNFIEMLKLVSGGARFAAKHFHFDPAELDRLYREGKKVQFHLGHNFNWELSHLAVAQKTKFTMLMVYMPLTNKLFDRIMRKIRGVTGNVLLPATNMKNSIMPYRDKQYVLGLVADQVPGNLQNAYWTKFFGRLTPFTSGPERGAIAGNIPVVFAEFYKTSRGQYRMNYAVAEENPASLQPGELTVRYARFLEESISRHPEMWLWSHRRWKREWTTEYEKRTFTKQRPD